MANVESDDQLGQVADEVLRRAEQELNALGAGGSESGARVFFWTLDLRFRSERIGMFDDVRLVATASTLAEVQARVQAAVGAVASSGVGVNGPTSAETYTLTMTPFSVRVRLLELATVTDVHGQEGSSLDE